MHNPKVTDELRIHFRQMPHWQLGGSVYFVTFRSARGELHPDALRIVVDTISAGHGSHFQLHLTVPMPDHVHLLLQPMEISPGVWRDLSAIMKGIKGASARRINAMNGESGSVWQPESFDRIVRDEQEYMEKWNYMLNNPVKSGLVEKPEDYPYTISGDEIDLGRK